ncbi:MAG: N-acetylmuramic acid 6-phosphate etherase [Bulleidia sp.]
MNFEKMETEGRNPSTMDIDRCSTLEIVEKINAEDRKAAEAVASQKVQIAEIIDRVSERLVKGGRMIYIGAGTSGRLGVLDASECPPTYGVSPDMVMGIIAGGENAMFKAKEGAEDDPDLAVSDLKALNLNENDSVIGLAASGRTPYVKGGLDYARSIGAYTAAVSCVSNAEISAHADTAVEAVTGAEVVTGSTRMKAGTAEKMICNMLSTGCMIRYGKVYENLMVDVQPTNEKLVQRAKRIIAQAVRCDGEKAAQLFEKSGRDVKIAIIMGVGGLTCDQAHERLSLRNGNVHDAIEALR